MTIAIARDREGFFANPDDWSEDMVPDLAQDEGIDPVTDDHWTVIRLMRREFSDKGSAPNVRALSKASGFGIKDLYALFPKGPAKTAAKLAGVPKPKGCI
jgi:TusE/DsrC/DsvC family sulfur relay protein